MCGLLGGSWDLVSKVISTLIGVISIITFLITLVAKSHEPLSRLPPNNVQHCAAQFRFPLFLNLQL